MALVRRRLHAGSARWRRASAWLLPCACSPWSRPPIFTPQAAACVGLLVPPAQRGRAITFVFLGWSVASVLGMPIGALDRRHLRLALRLRGGRRLSLVSAAWVWRTLPDGIKPPALSWATGRSRSARKR
jgi:DHA1 family inner membrane transport protein